MPSMGAVADTPGLGEVARDSAMVPITRKEWIAMPPKETDPLTIPVTKVHVSVENYFGPCFTREECTWKVKQIQNGYYDTGDDDIPYSFLIGNDGHVYEGRGWTWRPDPVIMEPDEGWPQFNRNTVHYMLEIEKGEVVDHKSISIGIIAGYSEANAESFALLRAALATAGRFVRGSVADGHIAEDFVRYGIKEDITDQELIDMSDEKKEIETRYRL